MNLTVIGCGDAFGSGGRLQTSFHVATRQGAVLIDCGATTLIGMQRLGLPAGDIGTILISHLHGDHYSGLVWFLLHARHVDKRTAPLTIAGPPGVERRVIETSELLFPGSTQAPTKFELSFVELGTGTATPVGPVKVQPYEVSHPSGAPSYALRIGIEDRTIAFSGDTEWVEPLVDCARDADLCIVECYAYDESTHYHTGWRTLADKLPRLRAKKIMLTHMNARMLAHTAVAAAAGVAVAEDGMTLEV